MAQSQSSARTSKPRRTDLPSPGVMLVLTLLIIGGGVAALIGFRYHRQQRIIAHVEACGGTATTSLQPEWLHGIVVKSIDEERARGFGEIVAVDFNSLQWPSFGFGSGGPVSTFSRSWPTATDF